MLTSSQSNRRNLWWWSFAFAWFTIWHFFITWQVWGDPVRRVPGPTGDNTVMIWNLGWVHHALSHGSPGFWFPNAYYPDGFLFLYGTHTWLDGLLYWLASPILPAGIDGTILWANITMLVATVGTGLLVISCLRAWGVTHWPTLLLASSGVAFCWFRMFALMGHYHFFGTQWMLVALCLLSWGRHLLAAEDTKKAKRLLTCAGIALGVTSLNDQTMAVFAGVLGGLVILSLPAEGSGGHIKRWWSSGLLYYGLALIPASLHVIPLIVAVIDGRLNYHVDASGPRLVDATSFLLPSDFHFLGRHLKGLREEAGFSWSEGTYLGIVPGLLLILSTAASAMFLFSRRTLRRDALQVCFFATGAAWMFLILGLGDKLMIGREQLITAPGRLLKELPILNNIRLPQRWVWPAHLCIALAGASVLGYLLTGVSRRWLAWLPALLAVVPPLEGKHYPVPPPVDYRNDPIIRPPGIIEAVQARHNSGGVLMMPLEIAYAHGNIFQTFWGYDIPLTVAYTARMPFTVHETPWRGNEWGPETGQWLKDKKVSIVVFPFHDGNVPDFQPWIQSAKQSVPGLVVLNRFGQEI